MIKILSAFVICTSIVFACASTPGGNYEYDRGRALAGEGKWKEAIEFFNKAITKDPDNWTYYTNLGLTYYKLGDFKNSSKFLKIALDKGNQNATRTQLRYLYRKNSRLAELAEYYKSRVAQAPNELKSVNDISELGFVYFESEKFEDAIRKFSKAKMIAEKEMAKANLTWPDNSAVPTGLETSKEMNIGLSKYNDGNYTEALKAFKNAKELLKPTVNFVVEKYLDLARSKLKKTTD